MAGNSGRGISSPINSGSSAADNIHTITIGDGAPGSAVVATDSGITGIRGRTNLGFNGLGSPGSVDTNGDSSLTGGSMGTTGVGLVGSGANAYAVGGARDFGIGNSGGAGSLGANSRVSAGIVGAGISSSAGRSSNGASNLGVSIRNIAAAASSRNEGARDSDAVIGVAGLGMTTGGSGVGANGGAGTLTNRGSDAGNGGLVGVSGIVATRSNRHPNDVNVNVGAFGASVLNRRRMAGPGLRLGNRAFSGVSGVSRAISGAPARGSSGIAGSSDFSSRDDLLEDAEDERYFGRSFLDNEENGGDGMETRSRYNRGLRG